MQALEKRLAAKENQEKEVDGWKMQRPPQQNHRPWQRLKARERKEEYNVKDEQNEEQEEGVEGHQTQRRGSEGDWTRMAYYPKERCCRSNASTWPNRVSAGKMRQHPPPMLKNERVAKRVGVKDMRMCLLEKGRGRGRAWSWRGRAGPVRVAKGPRLLAGAGRVPRGAG
jgi:hypothetical protein